MGNVKIGNTDNIVEVVQYLEFLNSFYIKNAESVLNIIYIIGGAAGAYRRKTFERIGIYNTKNITEDIDLSVRICNKGMRSVYVDDAIIYTEGADSISGLAKQRFRWKIGWFKTIYANRNIIFSKKKEHNKTLSWAIIPLGYFTNFQLLIEPFFVLFIYIYSYIKQDFLIFLSWIFAEFVMISLIIILDRKNQPLRILFLTPIVWLLFYLTTLIEFKAFLSTLTHWIRKKDAQWQKWNRKGIVVSNNKKI